MRILKSIIIKSSCLLFLGCNNENNNVYYYIPENVNKPFAIVYNSDLGVTTQKNEKGQLIYVIPDDRILYVKNNDQEPNVSKSKIYYINKNKDTIKRIRNYYFDLNKNIPIKKGDVYELNSYYKTYNKSKKVLEMQIVIITNDFTEEGKENAIKSAVDLENYINEN